jgi:hypothetical protein
MRQAACYGALLSLTGAGRSPGCRVPKQIDMLITGSKSAFASA